ncbi:MAG: lactonase family protein, partial [Bdellovibrionaceae bacterium]|nr:lactonase family protein [Pseudobdellovibrionaceae bacterium]
MVRGLSLVFLLHMMAMIFLVGCSKPTPRSSSDDSSSATYLYVASGMCYSGNNTTFNATSASDLIFRINTVTGQRDTIIADFNALPAVGADTPVGIVDFDANTFLVLVEGSPDRIERVEKKANGARTSFLLDTTILTGTMRRLAVSPSTGDLIITRTNAVERYSQTSGRRAIGGTNPWINNPGGSCATSNTNMASAIEIANGMWAFVHAAASQNRIGIIKNTGYSVTADCLAAQAAPNTNAFPTDMVWISSANQLIVAYAGNATTTDLNSIYVYNVNPTTGAISSPTKIYESANFPSPTPYLLYGISAMAYDAPNSHLYVATAISSATT